MKTPILASLILATLTSSAFALPHPAQPFQGAAKAASEQQIVAPQADSGFEHKGGKVADSGFERKAGRTS
jgi:hypothetical protein